MRNGPRNTDSTSSTTSTYFLPLDAHATLITTRDELRLLAQLAEPRGDDDRGAIALSTEALSECFGRMAEQLDTALERMEREA